MQPMVGWVGGHLFFMNQNKIQLTGKRNYLRLLILTAAK